MYVKKYVHVHVCKTICMYMYVKQYVHVFSMYMYVKQYTCTCMYVHVHVVEL